MSIRKQCSVSRDVFCWTKTTCLHTLFLAMSFWRWKTLQAQLTHITRPCEFIIRTIEHGMVLARSMSSRIMWSSHCTTFNEQPNATHETPECGMLWVHATKKYVETRMPQFVLKKQSPWRALRVPLCSSLGLYMPCKTARKKLCIALRPWC